MTITLTPPVVFGDSDELGGVGTLSPITYTDGSDVVPGEVAPIIYATIVPGWLYAWNGTMWMPRPAKCWTGSEWIEPPMKVWTGTEWELV